MTQRKTRALAPVGVALLVLPVIAVSVASPCHSVLQRLQRAYTFGSPEGPEQKALAQACRKAGHQLV